MSAWIKTTAVDNEPIISWGRNRGGRKWTFRVQDDNGPDGAIRIEVNGGYHVGTTNVADGQWHHVACTWENDGSPNVNDARLWVDGELEGRGAVRGRGMNTASNANVRIGRAVMGGRFFDGTIDEVRVYDHALGRNEVRALAAQAPDPYYAAVQADAPIAYWRLGEPSGGNAFNEGSLGSAVDGSYTGGPSRGEPSLVPIIPNTAVHFDSNNDKVNIPDHDAINSGDGPYPQRSIESWFVVDPNTRNRLVVYQEGGRSSGFNMYVQHAGDDTHHLRYGAWTNLTGSQRNHFPSRVQVELGEACHAASVFDADAESLILYLNGAPVSAKVNANVEPIDKHGGNIAIGAKRGGTRFDNGGKGGTGNYFAGTIDEVAVYDAALTLRRIQNHYVTGVGDPMAALGLRPKTTLGVLLNYDATFDTDGDDDWEDSIGTRPNGAGQNQFDLGVSGIPRLPVSSQSLRVITRAYAFDGADTARTREYQDIAGEPSRFSASFELAFKPSDLAGFEAIAEIGGGANGTGFWLEDSILHFGASSGGQVETTFDLASLPEPLRSDFLHVIGVLDMEADQALLYVDGALRDAADMTAALDQWSGGNDVGLGGVAGGMVFGLHQQGIEGLDGQIALFRVSEGVLTGAEVAANFEALQPEPTTLTLLGLGALALLRRRRRA
jgi:hypothetical protein